MVRLDLSDQEAATLKAVLESDLADLSFEISSTDSLDYREALKRRKATVIRLIEMLSPSRQAV